MILLAAALGIQFWGDDESKLYTAAGVLTGTFMYCLMGNPLIMDYIKKYSRGRVAALQEAGKIIGEFIGFAVLIGIFNAGGDVGAAFIWLAVTVFVIGFFVACLMVKEKKISIVYMVDPLGVHQIVADELEESDDTDDEGLDLGDLKEAADNFFLGAASRLDKCKKLHTRVYQVFTSDRILWFGVYASWVHKMMAYTYTTYFWLYVSSWT